MADEASEPAIRYYYFRDANKRPIVTLCKYIDGGAVGYGWAVCSVDDPPCKRTGRAIALERAKAAIHEHGILCEDTQHVYRWKRDLNGWKAQRVIHQCDAVEIDGFCMLAIHSSAQLLPESMKS